jgi:Hsp70 protein.
LIYTTEKSLSELGDKYSPEDKTRIENGLRELKDAVKENEMDEIKKKSDKLTKIVGEVNVKLYQQAQQAQQAQQQTTKQPEQQGTKEGDENVWRGNPVDVDYTKEDENKRRDAKSEKWLREGTIIRFWKFQKLHPQER